MRVTYSMGAPCHNPYEGEADSIAEAEGDIRRFFDDLDMYGSDSSEAWGTVSPADDDYPMYTYSVGPRGGFRKEKA